MSEVLYEVSLFLFPCGFGLFEVLVDQSIKEFHEPHLVIIDFVSLKYSLKLLVLVVLVNRSTRWQITDVQSSKKRQTSFQIRHGHPSSSPSPSLYQHVSSAHPQNTCL